MQTQFRPDQLINPKIAEADQILRKCVHCGFCTATCPTYVLLGDELDSPRGRIYLIKEMLENERAASAEDVKHIDRCLTCLSCMSTCPASVDYMHLVDQARVHIENTYARPIRERVIRSTLAQLLPYPRRFKVAMALGRIARFFKPLAQLVPVYGRYFRPLLDLVPTGPRRSAEFASPGLFETDRQSAGRVALLPGCVQPTLKPEINDATVRLFNRLGFDVAVPNQQCCGALVQHIGHEDSAMAAARRNIDLFDAENRQAELKAIIINASGCGTTVKDYGHLLRRDAEYSRRATEVSGLARDVSEFLFENIDRLKAAQCPVPDAVVAYHSACSMQHGQGIKTAPQALLRAAGFTVREIPEGHLCCGSAGIYNVLQPELARQLRDRKIANIERVTPDLIATGNVGCMTQLGAGTDIPVVHTVELLDWAMGGPVPPALEKWAAAQTGDVNEMQA